MDAARSPIIMAIACVGADGMRGAIDESATLNPEMPCTLQQNKEEQGAAAAVAAEAATISLKKKHQPQDIQSIASFEIVFVRRSNRTFETMTVQRTLTMVAPNLSSFHKSVPSS